MTSPGSTLFWRSAGASETGATASFRPGPPTSQPALLADAVSAAVATAPRRIAYAALPFDRSAASTIVVPVGDAAPPVHDAPTLVAAASPAPETYLDAVRTALSRIAAGDAEKVVVARYRDLMSPVPADPAAIAARLAATHAIAHVFALPVGENRHLVGASPELLLAKSGGRIRSHPLAGSARRSADSVADREIGDALRASEKDLREHAYVVEAICDILAPHCRTLTAPAPDLLATDSMWHLGTEIAAELRDPDCPLAALAAQLHPTPAVCGTPRAAAAEVIAEAEDFDRGFFAGAVGWQDARGDGEWAVAIRCGEVTPHRVRAYAGAGIVRGSDPTAELAETEGKLSTFLAALTPTAVGTPR